MCVANCSETGCSFATRESCSLFGIFPSKSSTLRHLSVALVGISDDGAKIIRGVGISESFLLFDLAFLETLLRPTTYISNSDSGLLYLVDCQLEVLCTT